MKYEDDRTAEQRQTHPVIWLGTDRFLSGWGGAEGGLSYAGWACKPEDDAKVERWIRRRGDMKNVRQVYGEYRPKSRNCKHCHIYLVGDNHPAIS